MRLSPLSPLSPRIIVALGVLLALPTALAKAPPATPSAQAACVGACENASEVLLNTLDDAVLEQCVYACRAGSWSDALTTCITMARSRKAMARCERQRLKERENRQGENATETDGFKAPPGLELVPITGKASARSTNNTVTVSTTGIAVGGIRRASVTCKFQGRPCSDNDHTRLDARFSIDPINKEHGKRESLLIVPVHEAISAAVKAQKDALLRLDPVERREYDRDSASRLNLAIDYRIPYRTVAELVYSAAMSEIYDIRFVVGQANHLSALAIHAPRVRVGMGRREHHKKPLNLTVTVKKSIGILLTWDEDLMADAVNAPVIGMVQVAAELCSAPNSAARGLQEVSGGCFSHDWPALYAALVKMKAKFSSAESPEEQIHVTADSNTPFALVARAIEVAQCKRPQAEYESMVDFEASRPSGPECDKLFPIVVLALNE